MNLKRTMSQALHASKLTGEAAAFVAAGAAGAAVSSAPAPGLSQEPRADIAPLTVPALASEPRRSEPEFVHSPLPAERRAPISVTFRLPSELPAALLRVAMERKLRREEPFTQQDIVAQAGREWLERNGHRE